MLRKLRPALAALVLFVTAVLFVRYFTAHPQYWQQLRSVSPWTILWVLLLNCAMILVLVALGFVAVQLCGRRIGMRENFLLTAYSSLANFFGPLQSGPGVRAVYLKSRHQVRLRDYTLASLLNLGLYALFSAFFLLVGTRPWWQTILGLLIVGGFSALVVRYFQKRDKKPAESHFHLTGRLVGLLIGLSFLQVLITIVWYYVELNAVHPGIHLSQAASYAGAANFALFVSITPDAVGIREGFLIFSQHLHHISTHDIVAANVIDRAVYVIFLVILFAVVLSLHARERLQLSAITRRQAAADAEQSLQ